MVESYTDKEQSLQERRKNQNSQLILKQALHDITGQLQVRHMLYTLYFDINLRVVKMLQTY